MSYVSEVHMHILFATLGLEREWNNVQINPALYTYFVCTHLNKFIAYLSIITVDKVIPISVKLHVTIYLRVHI